MLHSWNKVTNNIHYNLTNNVRYTAEITLLTAYVITLLIMYVIQLIKNVTNNIHYNVTNNIWNNITNNIRYNITNNVCHKVEITLLWEMGWETWKCLVLSWLFHVSVSISICLCKKISLDENCLAVSVTIPDSSVLNWNYSNAYTVSDKDIWKSSFYPLNTFN